MIYFPLSSKPILPLAIKTYQVFTATMTWINNLGMKLVLIGGKNQRTTEIMILTSSKTFKATGEG
jgi:hypothetical protein